MGISIGQEDTAAVEHALERVRENRPRLEALVKTELERNIVTMTGPFSSLRHISSHSRELVEQFLSGVSGEPDVRMLRKQVGVWVGRGLGPEGAFAVVDVLCDAGGELAGSDALQTRIANYRREFYVAYERARHIETLSEQEKMQRGLYATLENQINAEYQTRTALVRRQNQLQIAADLGRVINPIREMNELMSAACGHLYERFALAFVGIFIVDEFGSWAILRSGTGEVGSDLLAHGYQLNLEEQTALSIARRENQPILLENGTDPRHPYLKPLLPQTNSGAVIPLNVRGRSLGFLTTHSDTLSVFTSQDNAILTLIGDTLAYGIENTELYARTAASLQEVERAQRGYVRDAWADRESRTEVLYSQQRDAFESENLAPSNLALSNGDAPASALSVPITLRGEVIGTVDLFDSTRERTWSESEKALATTVVEQMALAVENARLFEVTQRRAQETAILNEMAQALSGELEPAQLFLQVHEYLPRLLPTDAFIVWLYDDTTGLVTRPALFDMGIGYPDEPMPRLPSRSVAHVIESDEAVIINLTPDEWEAEKADAGAIVGSSDPSASLAYVPLRVGTRLRGVLSAQTYTLSAYGESQVALLTGVANYLATALENAQLFSQTQEVLAETQTLYEISARLNASNSLQEALEAASGPAIVLGAFNASLMRVDVDESGEPVGLEIAAVWPRNSDPVFPTGARISPESLAGEEEWTENPNEPYLFENLLQDPRTTLSAKETYATSQIQATALLPMKIGSRWIGVMNFNWQEPRTFTSRDVRLFRSVMAQAATVLDNRSLFEQTQVALQQTQEALEQVQQAQDRLNLQYQTANILARAISFEHAADSLLENTCRSLNWQMGEYWAFDEQTERLALWYAWYEQTPVLDDFAQDARGLSFGSGEGLVGQTWAQGRPVWIHDLYEDADFKQLTKAKQGGLKSALAFPLSSEMRVFGVMVFFSTHPQPMDDTLMASMIGVGSQIGQFLERRRAEEAVRQQNTYLTALHEITLGLIRRLDIDELLQSIIARAGELVGTQHGYVHLIEPAGTELRMRAGIGVYEEFVGSRVKAGQGLAGTVWRDDKPIVVDDYRYWHGRLPMVDRDVLRAVVGVPLRSGDQTVGVLGLASLEEGRRFGAAQIEALNRFAELAAIALDNAQLYNVSQLALRQTQRLAQREKASAEIADKLHAAPDVQAVLRTAAEELRRNTGSRRATVRLNLGGHHAPPDANGIPDANGGPHEP